MLSDDKLLRGKCVYVVEKNLCDLCDQTGKQPCDLHLSANFGIGSRLRVSQERDLEGAIKKRPGSRSQTGLERKDSPSKV